MLTIYFLVPLTAVTRGSALKRRHGVALSRTVMLTHARSISTTITLGRLGATC